MRLVPWNRFKASSKIFCLLVCLFVLLLYIPSQQLWSWRDGQFILPHFFLGKLEQAVNQYFVHTLPLVTDSNPSWMIQGKEQQWPKKLFHDQSPRMDGTGPVSNSRPLDLQSDSHVLSATLPIPTALRGIFLPTIPRRYFFVEHLCYYVLCLSCFRVCSLLPCGHLLGKGWPLDSRL